MKPIARLCVCAALSSLFAAPALADEGFYVRLAAGGGLVDELSFGSVTFDPGYAASASIGYNWFFPETIADFRAEIEASYRDNDMDEIASLPANGGAEVYSLMFNGLFDVRTNLPFVPYFGGGVGMSQIRFESDGAGGAFATFDDIDTVVSYQAIGGISYDLGSHLAVGLEYRFIGTTVFEFTSTTASIFSSDYLQHSAFLTMTFGF